MPDLVGDDLVVGILHDVADFGGLVPLAHLIQGNTVKQQRAASLAVGCENGFEMTQERRLSAAAAAAQGHIGPLPNGEIHVLQSVPAFGGRVGKGQILDLEMCHNRASLK